MKSLYQGQLLRVGYNDESGSIPLTLSPGPSCPGLREVVTECRDVIDEKLQEFGALLFRGFGSGSVDAFAQFTREITPQLIPYTAGTSPRVKVQDDVYTSTEYPARFPIAMHNEMSYHSRWPDLVYFYCAVSPSVGGETPIADSREVLKRLPRSVISEFRARNVSYLRRLSGSCAGFGSWQHAFGTHERADVEEYCRARGASFSWEVGGTLLVRETQPAIRVHPRTSEEVWFNQAHMWHVSNSPIQLKPGHVSESDLPMNATFGDGGSLDVAMLDEIRAAYRGAMKLFKWRLGDLLLLDNVLVAHGRMAFQGTRRILVTMGNL